MKHSNEEHSSSASGNIELETTNVSTSPLVLEGRHAMGQATATAQTTTNASQADALDDNHSTMTPTITNALAAPPRGDMTPITSPEPHCYPAPAMGSITLPTESTPYSNPSATTPVNPPVKSPNVDAEQRPVHEWKKSVALPTTPQSLVPQKAGEEGCDVESNNAGRGGDISEPEKGGGKVTQSNGVVGGVSDPEQRSGEGEVSQSEKAGDEGQITEQGNEDGKGDSRVLRAPNPFLPGPEADEAPYVNQTIRYVEGVANQHEKDRPDLDLQYPREEVEDMLALWGGVDRAMGYPASNVSIRSFDQG